MIMDDNNNNNNQNNNNNNSNGNQINNINNNNSGYKYQQHQQQQQHHINQHQHHHHQIEELSFEDLTFGEQSSLDKHNDPLYIDQDSPQKYDRLMSSIGTSSSSMMMGGYSSSMMSMIGGGGGGYDSPNLRGLKLQQGGTTPGTPNNSVNNSSIGSGIIGSGSYSNSGNFNGLLMNNNSNNNNNNNNIINNGNGTPGSSLKKEKRAKSDKSDRHAVLISTKGDKINLALLLKQLEECGAVRAHHFRERQTFGFVQFLDSDSADNAIEQLNYKDVDGQILTVERIKRITPGKDPRIATVGSPQCSSLPTTLPSMIENKPDSTLVLKNLPFNLKQVQLQEILEGINPSAPQSVNFHYDNIGVFRGMAFVKYRLVEDAVKVFDALNGTDVHGRRVRLEYKRKVSKSSEIPQEVLEDEQLRRVWEQLKEFKDDPISTEITFNTFTGVQRMYIHNMAEKLKLSHTSVGEEPNRSIVVTNKKSLIGTPNQDSLLLSNSPPQQLLMNNNNLASTSFNSSNGILSNSFNNNNSGNGSLSTTPPTLTNNNNNNNNNNINNNNNNNNSQNNSFNSTIGFNINRVKLSGNNNNSNGNNSSSGGGNGTILNSHIGFNINPNNNLNNNNNNNSTTQTPTNSLNNNSNFMSFSNIGDSKFGSSWENKQQLLQQQSTIQQQQPQQQTTASFLTIKGFRDRSYSASAISSTDIDLSSSPSNWRTPSSSQQQSANSFGLIGSNSTTTSGFNILNNNNNNTISIKNNSFNNNNNILTPTTPSSSYNNSPININSGINSNLNGYNNNNNGNGIFIPISSPNNNSHNSVNFSGNSNSFNSPILRQPKGPDGTKGFSNDYRATRKLSQSPLPSQIIN